jgi:hypothetical protein
VKINERVIIMREAITKIVPLLSEKNVRVTSQGSRAYVEYHPRTGEPIRVNVPYMPDDASDTLLDAIQGFLDHEIGHILFTDFEVVAKAHKAKVAQLHNIVEDPFVEKKMALRFTGSGANLEATGRFFLNTTTVPMLEKHPDRKTAILIVPAVRAWAGQILFRQFMDEGDRWASIEEFVRAVGPDMPDLVLGCKSSEDCLAVAKLMQKRLKAADDARKSREEAEKKKEEEKKDEDSGEGEGKGKGKAKKGKKKPAETPKEPTPAEPPEDDEGSSGPDDTPLGDEDEDDSTPAADDELADDPEPGEPGEPGDEAGGPGEGDEGEAGEEGEEGEEGLRLAKDSERDDDGRELDIDTGGKGESTGEDGSEKRVGSGKTPGEDGEPLSGKEFAGAIDEDGAAEDKPEFDLDAFTSELESSGDFDDGLCRALSESAKKAIAESPYAIFTTDDDECEPLALKGAPVEEWLRDLADSVDHMVGPLQKDIERAMAAISRSVMVPGYKSGRLNPGALSRLQFGRDDVFRRKLESSNKDVAVELLVDCSGSMTGPKIRTAAYAAYALASVLERVRIPCEVVGFTTKLHSKSVMESMRAEGSGLRYSRTEALFMPILKGWNERIGPEVKRRFADTAQGRGVDLRENVDGESVLIAAHRLRQRRETRKVLMVFSDGAPMCSGDTAALYKHLADSVVAVERSGVEVIGMGIQSHEVQRFYKRHIVMKSVSELPGEVMRQLKGLLVAHR